MVHINVFQTFVYVTQSNIFILIGFQIKYQHSVLCQIFVSKVKETDCVTVYERSINFG
jgi:hypothetical protein